MAESLRQEARQPMAKSAVLYLRIPSEVHADLTREAAERNVSMNWLAGQLLREALAALLPVPIRARLTHLDPDGRVS